MKNLIKLAFIALSAICFNADIAAQQIVYIPQALPNDYLLSSVDAVGKVKSIKFVSDGVTQSEMKYNEKGLLAEVSSFDLNGNLLNKGTNTYDATGKPLKTDLEIFGDLMKDGNHQTTLYVYDKAGKLIAQNADKSEKKGYSTRYTYNENGKVDKTSYFYNGKISSFDEYKYDAKGQVIEITNYKCLNGSNCDYSNSSKYTYDDKGQLVAQSMDGVFEGNSQYTYNDKGQIIAKKSAAQEGTYSYSDVYTYNEKGQLLKSESTGITEDDSTIYINNYEYDEQGNWIKIKSESTGDGDITAPVTRIIEYY